MKKQFLRVKQLADQTFLRADKSEGLNQDELRKADTKVEFIQRALTEVGKKLPIAVNDADKRKKKYDEFNIKQAIDASIPESLEYIRDDLLYQVLVRSSSMQGQLADEKYEYEKAMEEHVSIPINQILEKELPAISKQKKLLNKHILDKDSATSRYQSARKVGTHKESNLKEEADEADMKLDQSRDSLATEMFSLLRRENEICTFFLQLLKMQRSYHESACKHLQEMIPILEQTVGENKIKPIFGSCLQNHLKTTGRKIAFPLEVCVLALTELGMSEEGLFRLTGSGSRVKRLKYSIDSGCFAVPLIPEYKDVHVLASTLKMYLRELPEPLLTYKLYNEWLRCVEYPEEQLRVAAVQAVLAKLPPANRDNLAFLMQFLSKLSKQPENRMTPTNIAIVMGPNLLWSQEKEDINMHLCSMLNTIVEIFLTHLDALFPTDMMKHCEIKPADLIEPDDFVRPDVISVRQSTLVENDGVDSASPKPSSRKKTRHAPAPPTAVAGLAGARNEVDVGQENYYHSAVGTASLNRSHKIRAETNKLLQKEGGNGSDSRRSSLIMDQIQTEHANTMTPQASLVNLDSNRVEQSEHQSDASNRAPSPAHPQHPPPPQAAMKPVAAPRTSIMTDFNADRERQLQRNDSMSKSLNSIEFDGEVLLRNRIGDESEQNRRAKPAIPTRPASLRGPSLRANESEAVNVRTFNTPHKLQPSVVNIQQKHPVGHDVQIAEKEKFLGHVSSANHSAAIRATENKADVNLNNNSTRPSLPTKPPLMKSNEKLAETAEGERVNGNPSNSNKPSHARTRSDGNIVDVPGHALQTPPSPRNLNKPSQPPPPPPTGAPKAKAELETANL